MVKYDGATFWLWFGYVTQFFFATFTPFTGVPEFMGTCVLFIAFFELDYLGGLAQRGVD